MFDFIPNEIYGFKVLHLFPFLLFGPFFLFFFYNMALKDILNPSDEIREIKKRQKIERLRQKEERKKLAAIEKARIVEAGEQPTPLQYVAQAIFFVPFAVVIGYLSNSPTYTILGPGKAIIKLSLSIPGKHKGKCIIRTKEELAKLPANKRIKKICPRERWPVRVAFNMDGKSLYSETVKPVGLTSDGQSRVYQSFVVSAGVHKVFMGINDNGDADNYTAVFEKEISIASTEILVFTFDTTKHVIFTK